MDSQLVLTQAKAAIEAEDYQSARSLLWRLVQEFPDLEEAWLLLAHISQDKSRTISFLEQAKRINPDNVQVQRELDRLKKGEIEEVNLFAAIQKPKPRLGDFPKDFYEELKPLSPQPLQQEIRGVYQPEPLTRASEEPPYTPPLIPVKEEQKPGDKRIPIPPAIIPELQPQDRVASDSKSKPVSIGIQTGSKKNAWIIPFLIGIGLILVIYMLYPILNFLYNIIFDNRLPANSFLTVIFILLFIIWITLIVLFRKVNWISFLSLGIFTGSLVFVFLVFLIML